MALGFTFRLRRRFIRNCRMVSNSKGRTLRELLIINIKFRGLVRYLGFARRLRSVFLVSEVLFLGDF